MPPLCRREMPAQEHAQRIAGRALEDPPADQAKQ
jgi:hypothetical protein